MAGAKAMGNRGETHGRKRSATLKRTKSAATQRQQNRGKGQGATVDNAAAHKIGCNQDLSQTHAFESQGQQAATLPHTNLAAITTEA